MPSCIDFKSERYFVLPTPAMSPSKASRKEENFTSLTLLVEKTNPGSFLMKGKKHVHLNTTQRT